VRITVLGGGSWGTTIASITAVNTPTLLWAREPDVAAEISNQHRNSRYLADLPLPESLQATSDLQLAAEQADVLVVGLPSHAMRSVLTQLADEVRAWVPVVSLAKGLEAATRLRPTQIIADCLPGHPIALLAGPNIAAEILEGFAAAAVVSTPDDTVARALQPLFTGRRFRVYRNIDLLGCEMGGVLKNVIAIASGMGDGLGVGDNTRAAVLTRGLAEMTRLGEAMGANPRTFAGLTGLGDLLTTAMSQRSRNRRIGEAIARGMSTAEAVAAVGQVAEGVKTAPIVMELAAQYRVPMPICGEVSATLAGRQTPVKSYRGLIRMQAGGEHEPH
jgi:glycerol-3-phosphate dehydrogenase (NAD(P)+)